MMSISCVRTPHTTVSVQTFSNPSSICVACLVQNNNRFQVRKHATLMLVESIKRYYRPVLIVFSVSLR